MNGFSVMLGVIGGRLPEKKWFSKEVHGLLMYQISSLWHRLDLCVAAEQRKITQDLLFLWVDNHDRPLYKKTTKTEKKVECSGAYNLILMCALMLKTVLA